MINFWHENSNSQLCTFFLKIEFLDTIWDFLTVWQQQYSNALLRFTVQKKNEAQNSFLTSLQNFVVSLKQQLRAVISFCPVSWLNSIYLFFDRKWNLVEFFQEKEWRFIEWIFSILLLQYFSIFKSSFICTFQ